MARSNPAHRQGTARSRDGSRIAYRVVGEGDDVCVFVPGLGVPWFTYAPFMERLRPRFRTITWAPRGTYDSRLSSGASLGVADHVDDIRAVLAEERVDRCVIGGWSLAVQISLEFAHQHPERCRGLILINGTYRAPVSADSSFRGRAARLLPTLRRVGPVLGAGARRALSATTLSKSVLRRSGLVAANHDFFLDVARAFAEQPIDVLAATLEAFEGHTAEPYLRTISIPSLVTAGTADWMTPPRLSREMAEQLPDAVLVEIPGGTHYTPIEFPHQVGEAIERFASAQCKPPAERRGVGAR